MNFVSKIWIPRKVPKVVNMSVKKKKSSESEKVKMRGIAGKKGKEREDALKSVTARAKESQERRIVPQKERRDDGRRYSQFDEEIERELEHEQERILEEERLRKSGREDERQREREREIERQ